MPKHKKKSTTSRSRPVDHAVYESGPEDAGITKSYNINGEKFTLADDTSGDSGWPHICNRHLGTAASTDDLEFPDGTTEEEVLELIEKTIANGKWYPEKRLTENERLPGRERRVYLWDSRADSTAGSKGIHQVCVITSNENSKKHYIITAYPRHGESIGRDERKRNNIPVLENEKKIENATGSIAQSTTVIQKKVDELEQKIIEYNNDRWTDEETFLNHLLMSQLDILNTLNKAKGQLNTAKITYARLVLNNKSNRSHRKDGKLPKLAQKEIGTAAEKIDGSETVVNNFADSINHKYAELRAGVGSGDRLSKPQPEQSESNHSNQSEIDEINKMIQSTNDKINNIKTTLNEWSKTRSMMIEEAANVPLIYGPESQYTYYEYLNEMLKADVNIKSLGRKKDDIVKRSNKSLNDIKRIRGSSVEIQDAEKRIHNEKEMSEYTIREGLQFTAEMLEAVKTEISMYETAGKDPSVEAAQHTRELAEMSKFISIGRATMHVGKRQLDELGEMVLTLNPQSMRPRRIPATLHSMTGTNLKAFRSIPDAKKLVSDIYTSNNKIRADTDTEVRNAEDEFSQLVEQSKYIQDGPTARSYIRPGEDELKTIKKQKAEIDTVIAKTNSDLTHIFPDISTGK